MGYRPSVRSRCFCYSRNFWAEVIKWLDNQRVNLKIEHLFDKDILFGILGVSKSYFNC